MHSIDSFQNKQGYKIFHQSWKVANPKVNLVIIHGIAEHSDRYLHVVKYFNEHNINVFALDLQGHGNSEGEICNVNRYRDFLDEIETYIITIQPEFDNKAYFVYGHSMGGGLVTALALEDRLTCNGIILSGALLKVNEDLSPILQKLSPIISALAPQLKTVQLDATLISKDPSVVDAYLNDPRVYYGGIKARIASELLKMSKWIQQRMPTFDAPVLILHGAEDQLTKTEGSIMLHEQAISKDKILKIYDGLYHEILNEPERQMVMHDMLAWMEARI